MKSLQEKIGYSFGDISLLEHALTHSSFANESKGRCTSNERLEFLGDSVLGMVVADHLYRTCPDMPEGDLTRTRAALVREESLVEVARQWGLGAFLRLGKGEELCGGRQRPSIQADAVEAVLAAVYLDGGIGSARKIIHRFIIDGSKPQQVTRDYKTALQELVQQTPGSTVTYRLVGESGPDHCRVFLTEVSVDGTVVGSGEGHSKKAAEQMAARAAFEKLTEK